jgi:hypothetical protein
MGPWCCGNNVWGRPIGGCVGGLGDVTLCSAVSGLRVVVTLGSDDGRFVTMASSCVAIFRRSGLHFPFFNFSRDSKSLLATAPACCAGLSVGSL